MQDKIDGLTFSRKMQEKTMSQFLLQSMEGVQLDFVEPSPYADFRASGLPYCGIRLAEDYLLAKQAPVATNPSGDFFLAAGTAMHAVYQEGARVRFGPRVWGHYLCVKCNHKHEFTVRPKKCSNCKSHWINLQYEEVFVKNKCGLSGHIDVVVALSLNPLILHVGDYKTATKKRDSFGYSNWGGTFPKQYNVFQIQSYCATLTDMGYTVAGWTLYYLDRSLPPKTLADFKQVTDVWTPEKKVRFDRWLWSQSKTHKAGKSFVAGKGSVTTLLDTRPCKSKEDYTRIMESKFSAAMEVCPNFEICTKCKEAKLISRLNNAFKTNGLSLLEEQK